MHYPQPRLHQGIASALEECLQKHYIHYSLTIGLLSPTELRLLLFLLAYAPQVQMGTWLIRHSNPKAEAQHHLHLDFKQICSRMAGKGSLLRPCCQRG